MISQGEQLTRRLEEERRWFLQSCLILLAFLVSLTPIFLFYLLSVTSRVQLLPAFSLLSWILFFSGASYNFIIYNFLNPQFRKKFCQLFYHKRKESTSKTSSTRFTFLSNSRKKSTESRSLKRARNSQTEKMECEPMIQEGDIKAQEISDSKHFEKFKEDEDKDAVFERSDKETEF